MKKYSQEFKDKCKKLYPTWSNLLKALDKDSEIVGRYLGNACSDGIDFDVILNSNSLDELKCLAEQEKEKRNLYLEWFYLK